MLLEKYEKFLLPLLIKRTDIIHYLCYKEILYFFGYKTEFFSFQNNPKNLDPSYKMDLDLWDCLGRVNLVLQQNFLGLI